MSKEATIVFRGVDHSQLVKEEIEARVGKLHQFFDHIQSIQVTVERPHKHTRKGQIFQVHIIIHVPGKEIVTCKDNGRHEQHENLMVAVHDTFNAAERQLQEYARLLRGDVKMPSDDDGRKWGVVTKVFQEEGFGFLEFYGKEVYFHENSVLGNAFSSLTVGSEVKFVEEMGEKGPQASTVYYTG